MGFSGGGYAGALACREGKRKGTREQGTDPKVRVELASSHVRALMEAGLLRVEGMRCLDRDTKDVIRHLCLECSCRHR